MSSMSLEELRQALSQPNAAIKKRALSVIFNEVVVEARDLLQEFLSREKDPDLQGLGIKVVNKLQAFSQTTGDFEPEKILPILANGQPEARLLALRSLLGRQSPHIPAIIHRGCRPDESPDTAALIAEILKTNPHVENLPFIMRFLRSTSEKVRLEALEGLINIMNGCLYPHILKTLLDPAGPIKMKSYQVISRISRANLLDTLNLMLSAEALETNRLAAQLLPSFLNNDLLPVLSLHRLHRDAETAALIKRAMFLLAQRGCTEAQELLNQMANETPHGKQGSPFTALSAKLGEFIGILPPWLGAPLQEGAAKPDPAMFLVRIRDFFSRLGDWLAASFLVTYFAFGRRTPPNDKLCFKALQLGINRLDQVGFLQALAPCLPAPSGDGDLFPLVLAFRASNDFADPFFEELQSIHQGLLMFEEHPEEASRLLKPACASLENLLRLLHPMVTNRLAVRFTEPDGLKTLNFLLAIPASLDPKHVSNFELVINRPFLISNNSVHGLELFPFLVFDPSRKAIGRHAPSEHEIWEFLVKYKILEGFMAFLKEKPS